MKVVVLAAGRSKRLKPIEDKNFLMFLGKPLIRIQLEQLMKAGFDDFVVIGGAHNLERLQNVCVEMGKKGAKFAVVEQKDLDDGMAGALLSVEKTVGGEPMLVLSSNDVVDQEAYSALMKATKDESFSSYLIGKKVAQYFPGGYLKVDTKGQITGIIEKPGEGNEPSDLVNLVIHFHRNSSELFAALHQVASTKDDRYEVTMDHLIQQGTLMKVVPYDGFWQPVKYPWHVITLMNHFLEKIPEMVKQQMIPESSKPEIASTSVVRGEVYFEPGVRILDHATISGPAYIGANTLIANNALVRGAHIGANSVVGFGTEIARSYLGNQVWTHTNYIGDSIIGNDVSFGSGTVTGNLRLDEKNIIVNIQDEKKDTWMTKLGLITGNHVRCGINTSFMPGIKIGSNSFIGAGIVVAQDIADNQYVYGKMELTIKENKATLDSGKREQMKQKLP